MNAEYKNRYIQFGLNVGYYRKKNRLSQSMLAEFVDITPSYVSSIERGLVGPSFDVLFKLCDVLRIEPKQLFDFRDESYSQNT